MEKTDTQISRNCHNCMQIISPNLYPKYEWQTKEFCSLICLGKYL